MPNPAAVLYEAYRQHMNATGQSSTYLLAWHLIPDHEKLAWWAVVRARIKNEQEAV